ncbi:MAG: hypothetical protein LR015_12810 [Verrucomicrobia bacterium]|nr:hypothetical protein [Verrucomicrobiota bacterium]
MDTVLLIGMFKNGILLIALAVIYLLMGERVDAKGTSLARWSVGLCWDWWR